MQNNNRKIFFRKQLNLVNVFGVRANLKNKPQMETWSWFKTSPDSSLLRKLHSVLPHTPVFEVKHENKMFAKRTYLGFWCRLSLSSIESLKIARSLVRTIFSSNKNLLPLWYLHLSSAQIISFPEQAASYFSSPKHFAYNQIRTLYPSKCMVGVSSSGKEECQGWGKCCITLENSLTQGCLYFKNSYKLNHTQLSYVFGSLSFLFSHVLAISFNCTVSPAGNLHSGFTKLLPFHRHHPKCRAIRKIATEMHFVHPSFEIYELLMGSAPGAYNP